MNKEPQIPMTERIPLIKELVDYLISKGFESPECYNGSKFLQLWKNNNNDSLCTIHIYKFKDDWHNEFPEDTFAIRLAITATDARLENGVPTIIKAKTVKDFLDAFTTHKIMLIEEEIKKQKETIQHLKTITF
jgi:hypothetical protein